MNGSWCVALLQKFTKAVEEAKEIQDRRSGSQPLTDHDPIDFLDPSTFPSSDSDDADNDGPSARKVDLRPAPLEKEDAAGLQPHDALAFLQAAARVDTSALCAVSDPDRLHCAGSSWRWLHHSSCRHGPGERDPTCDILRLRSLLFCCAGQQRECKPVQAACIFSHDEPPGGGAWRWLSHAEAAEAVKTDGGPPWHFCPIDQHVLHICHPVDVPSYLVTGKKFTCIWH